MSIRRLQCGLKPVLFAHSLACCEWQAEEKKLAWGRGSLIFSSKSDRSPLGRVSRENHRFYWHSAIRVSRETTVSRITL
jgi:hypothetical protein